MELAAKLLRSFDFLPNYTLHVRTFSGSITGG